MFSVKGFGLEVALDTLQFWDSGNCFPLMINDVPPPVIMNNPGGQKLVIMRGAYLLKGFGRADFKFLSKSINVELKSH